MIFPLRTRFLLLSLLAALALLPVACKKERNDIIPNVYVDIYLYSYDPNFVNLNAVGGWVYITGGVKGIIVYRRSNTEFMAYERNSPYQPSQGCVVNVESSNVLIEDKCSNSQWLITDGSVTQGPTTQPLKQYHTSWDGTVVHIYN